MKGVYIQHRQIVNKIISEAKSSYYKQLVTENKGDSKKLFMIVNKLLSKKSVSPLPSGSDKDFAAMFSDYFVSKISKIRDSIQQIHGEKSASKSCGLDPMPTSLVKASLTELQPIITDIINQSIDTGIFPASFKQAHVTSTLKKTTLDPDVNKNYRPVSNLSFVSKILEKVIAAQLNDHLTSNKLHEPHQSAYRQGHSEETVLLRLHNDVIKAIGEKKVVLLVMLDLSAAFDTVSHQCLLTTLEELGVCDMA